MTVMDFMNPASAVLALNKGKQDKFIMPQDRIRQGFDSIVPQQTDINLLYGLLNRADEIRPPEGVGGGWGWYPWLGTVRKG